MRKNKLENFEEIKNYYDNTDLSDLILNNEEIEEFSKEKIIQWENKRKKRMKLVSIRLPENLISIIKKKADSLGIGYQTLIRMILMKDFNR